MNRLKQRQIMALKRLRLLGGSNDTMACWARAEALEQFTMVKRAARWPTFWTLPILRWTFHVQLRWPFLKVCRGLCMCDEMAIIDEIDYLHAVRTLPGTVEAQQEIQGTQREIMAIIDRDTRATIVQMDEDLHAAMRDIERTFDEISARLR